MRNPQRKIELLRRFTQLREVEKQRAAMQAAEAQEAHRKLLELYRRSTGIAQSLSDQSAADGAELVRQLSFASGLEAIRQQTAGETRKAETMAREATDRLRVAERRHSLAGDQLVAQRRATDRAREISETSYLAQGLQGKR